MSLSSGKDVAILVFQQKLVKGCTNSETLIGLASCFQIEQQVFNTFHYSVLRIIALILPCYLVLL